MNEKIKDIIEFSKGKGEHEYTFVALKPDSVNTTAISVVMNILYNNGYKVAFHSPVVYTKENVQTHYKEIYDQYVKDPNGKFKFYPELENYLTRGPMYGLVIEGTLPVKKVKALCGATKDPENGTMRNELFKYYGKPYDKNENGIHASGEVNEAMREIGNFLNAVSKTKIKKLCKDTQVKNVANYVIRFNNMLGEEYQPTL